MEHLGYKVVYDPTFDITTTDFNQYVVNMKSAGVKILFLEQMPENYAASVVKRSTSRTSTRSWCWAARPTARSWCPTLGVRRPSTAPTWSRTRRSFWERTLRGYRRSTPSSPGCRRRRPASMPTCTPCSAGPSAELFSQALKAAGSDPSRGSVLQALRNITSFSGRQSARPRQSSGQDPDQLLHHRHHRQREVPTAGRSTTRRADPRLPVRPAVLLLQPVTAT